MSTLLVAQKCTLITSLSEFISVFKQPTSSVVFRMLKVDFNLLNFSKSLNLQSKHQHGKKYTFCCSVYNGFEYQHAQKYTFCCSVYNVFDKVVLLLLRLRMITAAVNDDVP